MFKKFLNGYQFVFTMALVKPQPASDSPATAASDSQPARAPSAEYSAFTSEQPASNGATAASTTAATPAPPAPVSLAERLRPLVASNGKFRWRKISTLAVKVGATEYSVKVALRGMGAKFDRTENLVKVGSIGTIPMPAPTAPAPWNSASTDNGDNDDDAEDDDFIEGEDDDEESDWNEDEDESEDEDTSDSDDESDLEDEPVVSFVPDAGKVTVLRDLLNNPNYRWRKLPTLAQSAGLSESAAREYLTYIGATENRRGGLFRK